MHRIETPVPGASHPTIPTTDAEFSYPFPMDECPSVFGLRFLHLHSRGGDGHQDWWQACGLHPNRSYPHFPPTNPIPRTTAPSVLPLRSLVQANLVPALPLVDGRSPASPLVQVRPCVARPCVRHAARPPRRHRRWSRAATSRGACDDSRKRRNAPRNSCVRHERPSAAKAPPRRRNAAERHMWNAEMDVLPWPNASAQPMDTPDTWSGS